MHFGPSILRCRVEDVPTVCEAEEREPHSWASTFHLSLLAAIFGFAWAFQVGLFRLSEGVRFTAYPLLSTLPPPRSYMA